MAAIPQSVPFLDLLLKVTGERGWRRGQALRSLALSAMRVPGSTSWKVPGDKIDTVKAEMHRILDELDKTPRQAIQKELDAYNSRN